MAYCAICGQHDGLDNKCNYCGRNHCKAHTLPENHRCVGLRSAGWEKYKEARQKRNADHPKSPVEISDTTSTEDKPSAASRKSTPPKKKLDRHGWSGKKEGSTESGSQSGDSSYGRGWSTTPAKEKKRSHSGWWKKDKQTSKQKSTESTGDDSPPVETRNDSLPQATSGPSQNQGKSFGGLITASRPYAFFHAFGEFIITAISFIVDIPLRGFRFIFSMRGFLFLLVVAAGIGGYSALEGTGIPVVDDTVDGVIESSNSVAGGLSDDSSTHLGGKFGDVRLEGKQIIVEVEETNFDEVQIVTPGEVSDTMFIGVSGDYTFTAQQELPSGTYTIRAIARTSLTEETVVDSHNVELSQ